MSHKRALKDHLPIRIRKFENGTRGGGYSPPVNSDSPDFSSIQCEELMCLWNRTKLRAPRRIRVTLIDNGYSMISDSKYSRICVLA